MAARRARGSGSVTYDRQRKNYVGRLSVVIDGRRQRPSIVAGSRAEAWTKLRQLQADVLNAERNVQINRTSVGTYLTAWLSRLKIEASTISRYRSLLRNVESVPGFVTKRLDILGSCKGPGIILQFYDDLSAAGASASTVQKVHRMLHAAFEDARHLRTIAANPTDIPKKLKPRYFRPDVAPLSRHQEAALMNAVRGDRSEAIVFLALDAGMRQGELFALTWSDIDISAATVDVSKSVKEANGVLYIGPTKTKNRRVIDISPTTVAVLRQHRTALSEAGYSGTIVFPDQAGGLQRRQNFNRREFARILQLAEEHSGLSFAAVTFHHLRHTMATMLLADGAHIAAVSRRLGHSKVSTTLDYYAHVLPDSSGTLGVRFEQRVSVYEESGARAVLPEETALGKQLGKQDRSPASPGSKKPRQSLATTGFPNVPRDRIELSTPGFSDLCSTN